MHDNDGPFIKQKHVYKNYNGLDKIIHSPIPRRNEGQRLKDVQNWVDASYEGSIFMTLWTFCRMYFIQIPQTHCKLINWTKIFMD